MKEVPEYRNKLEVKGVVPELVMLVCSAMAALCNEERGNPEIRKRMKKMMRKQSNLLLKFMKLSLKKPSNTTVLLIIASG